MLLLLFYSGICLHDSFIPSIEFEFRLYIVWKVRKCIEIRRLFINHREYFCRIDLSYDIAFSLFCCHFHQRRVKCWFWVISRTAFLCLICASFPLSFYIECNEAPFSWCLSRIAPHPGPFFLLNHLNIEFKLLQLDRLIALRHSVVALPNVSLVPYHFLPLLIQKLIDKTLITGCLFPYISLIFFIMMIRIFLGIPEYVIFSIDEFKDSSIVLA